MSVAHEVREAPPPSPPPAGMSASLRSSVAAEPVTADWREALAGASGPELDGWRVQAVPAGVFVGPADAEVSRGAWRLAPDEAWPTVVVEAVAPDPAVLAAVGAVVAALSSGEARRVRLAVSFVDGLAAQEMAERHGVEVVATPGRVEVTRDGMAVAGGFDADDPLRCWEWWHYRPGSPPQPIGALLPSPAWEVRLRQLEVRTPAGAVVRRVPAGLALLPADVVDDGFLEFADAVRPDPDMLTVVVRAAGDDAAMWQATEDLVEAVRPAVAGSLRLVRPHSAHVEALARLVRRFDVAVVACDAIPWLHREDGSLLAAEGRRLGRWWCLRPDAEPEECGAIHPLPPWQAPLAAAFEELAAPSGLALDRVPAGLRLGGDTADPNWVAAAERAPDPARATLIVVADESATHEEAVDAVLATLPGEVGPVSVVAVGADGASGKPVTAPTAPPSRIEPPVPPAADVPSAPAPSPSTEATPAQLGGPEEDDTATATPPPSTEPPVPPSAEEPSTPPPSPSAQAAPAQMGRPEEDDTATTAPPPPSTDAPAPPAEEPSAPPPSLSAQAAPAQMSGPEEDDTATATFDASARALAARLAVSSAGLDGAGEPARGNGSVAAWVEPDVAVPDDGGAVDQAGPSSRPVETETWEASETRRDDASGKPPDATSEAGPSSPATEVEAPGTEAPAPSRPAESSAAPPVTRPIGPGHDVPELVGAAYRSSVEERRACRAQLAGRHDVHVVAVARVLAARPALRGPSTGEPDDAVAHDLAALRAYLVGDVGSGWDEELRLGSATVDRAVLGCVVSGLRRLPVHRGAVFAVAPATVVPVDSYTAGEVVVEPGLLRVGRRRPTTAGATAGPTVVFCLWSQRGRRVGLLAGDAEDVLLGPVTPLSVLAVEREEDGGGTVFLAEDGPVPPDALERLRAAMGSPAVAREASVLGFGVGLHPDGLPFRPRD